MKTLIPILIFLFSFSFASAQIIVTDKKPASGPINQVDENGKPNGVWLQRVRCADGACQEWGTYDHGRKIGKWYKINSETQLVAMETYKNNTLDGAAEYYDNGHLTSKGTYRGMNPDNPYDTIMVVDPETGAQKLKQVSTEKGSLRHGMWRYYDEMTGRLIKEEEYQVDSLIYVKEYPFSKADSTKYANRNANLPHNKKSNYTPPPSKMFSYINYK